MEFRRSEKSVNNVTHPHEENMSILPSINFARNAFRKSVFWKGYRVMAKKNVQTGWSRQNFLDFQKNGKRNLWRFVISGQSGTYGVPEAY